VVVAEGYMDVITLHGAGFTGAVAPLGTALTEGQLGELWKLADEPFLCFDGDNAGRRAAQRAAERALPLLRPGKSLRFVALPAGEDPDTLIRGRGAEAVRRVLGLARPLSDVIWDLETEGKAADTPERRASIRRAVEQRVEQIADPVVRDYYRRDIRERLDKAYRTPSRAWRPDARRPFRGGMQDPAPFAAGAAARRRNKLGSRREGEQACHAAGAFGAAPRESGLRVVSQDHGPDGLRPGEFRPGRHLAHARQRGADRYVRPAGRWHAASRRGRPPAGAIEPIRRRHENGHREAVDVCPGPARRLCRYAHGARHRSARPGERQSIFVAAAGNC